MHYLRRLLRNQRDNAALAYFGLPTSLAVWNADQADLSARRAEEIIAEQRSGLNLLAIIAAEGDVALHHDRRAGEIRVTIAGRSKQPEPVKVSPNLVPELSELVMQYKPDSSFINSPERMSGMSYTEIIALYR